MHVELQIYVQLHAIYKIPGLEWYHLNYEMMCDISIHDFPLASIHFLADRPPTVSEANINANSSGKKNALKTTVSYYPTDSHTLARIKKKQQ